MVFEGTDLAFFSVDEAAEVSDATGVLRDADSENRPTTDSRTARHTLHEYIYTHSHAHSDLKGYINPKFIQFMKFIHPKA